MAKPRSAAVKRPVASIGAETSADVEGKHRYCVYFVDTKMKRRRKSSQRLWQAVSKHTCLLRSDNELVSSFHSASPRSIWLSFDAGALSSLANHIAVSHSEHRLLLFSEVGESTRHVLNVYFRHVLAAKEAIKYLEPTELAEVLVAPNRADLFIGGTVDTKEQAVVLYRGTIDPVVVPLAWFVGQGSKAPKPDPLAFSVSDYGQTVRLGEFEAASDAILYEFDSDFRRRRKKELLKADSSLGSSIRRLRLQRSIRRNEFSGIAAKTIARIERNEIANPQTQTLAVIAARLGVKESDLGSY
jgi:hypothetical protein